MAVKFIAETDTLEKFRTEFNELCAQDFGDKANLSSSIVATNLIDAMKRELQEETGISPGQACVFYSKDEIGDKVLGGGWIHKTVNKNLSP